MTAAGHAVLGTIIAAKIADPALGLTLAFLSHIAADAIPHWDVATDKKDRDKGNGRMWLESIVDVLLGFALSYSVVFFFFPKTNLNYVFLMIIASQGMDWITAPYYFLKMKFPPFSWFYNFQKLFDNVLDKPWGLIIPNVVVLAILVLAIIF